MRDQVQRVVSKIVSRKLAMGFASWKQHFQLLVQTEQAEANRTRRMKTVLRRLESRLLSKSYKKWQYEFRQQKRLKKFLRRWLKRSQGRAFEGWINFVEERVQTRRLMTRVMARMQRVQLVRGFTSWMLFTRDFQRIELQKREKEMRKVRAEANRTRRMKTVLRRLESRLLSKAYLKWQFDWRQKKRVRNFVRRWLRRSQAQAFDRLCTFVDERVELREKLKK